MLTTKTILNQLTGKGIVDAFVTALEEKFDDFAQDKKRYLDTMRALQMELGEGVLPSVQDEMEAIEKQTACNLLFSGLLGIKANLDNFINPIERSFLDVDSDIYLRVETAHRLPEYSNAQNTREQFYAQLSPAQRELYENVITYTSHLETVGPKLAHYYGYILGNELIFRVIPGYHADTVQTTLYTAMITDYFGKQIL